MCPKNRQILEVSDRIGAIFSRLAGERRLGAREAVTTTGGNACVGPTAVNGPAHSVLPRQFQYGPAENWVHCPGYCDWVAEMRRSSISFLNVNCAWKLMTNRISISIDSLTSPTA